MTTNPRTPDEIMTDFDAAVAGQADIDPRAILWEIIEDIQHSYSLAMANTAVPLVDEETISGTVSDYLVNHYGDD
jgi:hypothetical protein